AQDVQPGRGRLPDQFGRGRGAVAGRRVGVKIDPHAPSLGRRHFCVSGSMSTTPSLSSSSVSTLSAWPPGSSLTNFLPLSTTKAWGLSQTALLGTVRFPSFGLPPVNTEVRSRIAPCFAPTTG